MIICLKSHCCKEQCACVWLDFKNGIINHACCDLILAFLIVSNNQIRPILRTWQEIIFADMQGHTQKCHIMKPFKFLPIVGIKRILLLRSQKIFWYSKLQQINIIKLCMLSIIQLSRPIYISNQTIDRAFLVKTWRVLNSISTLDLNVLLVWRD